MASPMREKRTWPPQDKDSDGETVAAFEAAVAVVKETVVRSGEVLVSAKEDLSDHQRWLKKQSAAVEADRERHDRWLHRQRDRQEALLRREQTRTRRRAKRQAVAQSIRGTASAVSFAVRSALWLVAARTMAGLNYIDALGASGLRWVGAWLGHFGLYVATAIRRGLSFAGGQARALALTLGMLASAGAAKIAAKAHVVAPSVSNFLSMCFGGFAARAHDASHAIGRGARAGLSGVSARADMLARSAGETLGPALSSLGARAHELAPALTGRIAQAGAAAGNYARGGASRAQALLARAKAPRVDAENAVSSSRRVGRFDLSQMLIIAGALLLVCGGLMLGGGFMLRAKTPGSSTVAAATAAEPIAWLFEHPSLPIEERAVFVVDTTPDGLRIKGFAIGGVNMSEDTLGSLGGVIKPDGHDQDLKLELSVEQPEQDSDAAHSPEAPAQPAVVLPDGAIPSQAPFKLVFLFPDGGMAPQEVVSASGGLLLKVHYEMDGKQRSLIKYLPTSLLEEQLAEIQAAAKGS
jgi:hypothetical protein